LKHADVAKGVALISRIGLVIALGSQGGNRCTEAGGHVLPSSECRLDVPDDRGEEHTRDGNHEARWSHHARSASLILFFQR
jgi:hypothetical protein